MATTEQPSRHTLKKSQLFASFGCLYLIFEKATFQFINMTIACFHFRVEVIIPYWQVCYWDQPAKLFRFYEAESEFLTEI